VSGFFDVAHDGPNARGGSCLIGRFSQCSREQSCRACRTPSNIFTRHAVHQNARRTRGKQIRAVFDVHHRGRLKFCELVLATFTANWRAEPAWPSQRNAQRIASPRQLPAHDGGVTGNGSMANSFKFLRAPLLMMPPPHTNRASGLLNSCPLIHQGEIVSARKSGCVYRAGRGFDPAP